jgi:hypothetical protein
MTDSNLFVNGKIVSNAKLQSVIDTLTTAVMSSVSTESVASLSLPTMMKPSDKIMVQGKDKSWSKTMTGERLTAKVAQAVKYNDAVKACAGLKVFAENAEVTGKIPTKGRQKSEIAESDLEGVFGK